MKGTYQNLEPVSYPADYFYEEIRCGFYVSGQMKRAWAAQLEVFREVEYVCEKLGIRCFASFGTLLGAVRHGGFVPWDDDFDVSMLRKDYELFHQRAKEFLPEGYLLLDHHSKQFDEPLMRVTNSGRICFDEPFLTKFHQFPYVAGIDIFPIDHIAPTPELEEKRKEQADIILTLWLVPDLEKKSPEVLETLKQVEQAYGKRFDLSRPLKPQLIDLAESMFRKYMDTEPAEVAHMTLWSSRGTHKYPANCFQDTIRMPFEQITVPVPAYYDQVLRAMFGEYLRIRRGGGAHGYPYFEAQEEQLIGLLGGHIPFRYEFASGDLIRPAVRSGTGDRKEAVFFLYRSCYWSSMQPMLEEVLNLEWDAYVIPLPVYDRDGKGGFTQIHLNTEGYPEWLPLTDFREYDLADRLPERIYIQNPFDPCSETVSFPQAFYSSELKKYTKELIYVSPFTLPDPDEGDLCTQQTMRYFVTVPGLVHADRVIVSSEGWKTQYVRRLTLMAGEETEQIWQKKIEVRNPAPAPQPDEERQKVILYYTGLGTLLEYGTELLQKIRRNFDVFAEAGEQIALLWRPDPLIERELPGLDPQLWDAFVSLRDEYLQMQIGSYDDESAPEVLAGFADAYYGDPGSMVCLFMEQGKPVMVQNCMI